MVLTAEQIQENWEKLMGYISTYIEQPRRDKLLAFYNTYQSRLILMPASHKTAYHSCYIGGYIEHVIRVVEAALDTDRLWKKYGVEENYTVEEVVFSALNHDLGKMGTKDEPMYIPNTSQWHIDNRGELYEVNNKIPFMSVPDRSLFLLLQHGVEYSENELLAIKLHDGIYDEANKPYLITFLPETKPRTSLIYIIHQADMLASRIEFEIEWMPKLKVAKQPKPKKVYTNAGKKSTSTLSPSVTVALESFIK